MSVRRLILQQAEEMAEGRYLRFDGREFRQHFGRQLTEFHPLAPERAGPESDFLSACMGSAYGRIRCRYEPELDTYLISKHAEDPAENGPRYHVDFDREHLFERGPDGMWTRRESAPTTG